MVRKRSDGGTQKSSGVSLHVGLDDGGPDHGRRAGVEAPGDLLDRGEADAALAEEGVDEAIADGDEDDEGEGVQVGEDVVGEAVEFHDGGLGGQVVVELVVRDPVEGVPQEDAAGVEAPPHLVDPGIVEGHPGRPALGREVARLDVLPEGAVVESLVRRDRVDVPAAFHGGEEQLESLAQDASLRGSPLVLVLARVDDGRAQAQQDGRQEKGEPEPYIFLAVHHSHLSN